MNVMIKGVVIATMLTMIACSNEAEVSEETVVDERLPAFDTSLPVAPVVEEEVAEEEVVEEEYRAGVADSVVDAL
jgi:hypothetical protein